MEQFTDIQLDEIFGSAIPAQSTDDIEDHFDRNGLIFENFRKPSEEDIFDGFDNRRMLEEIADGSQYTRSVTKAGRPMTDEQFDNAINWRLSRHTARTAGEVSQPQAVSDRFQRFSPRTDGPEPVHTQLDRITFELCNMVGNEIKVVQLRTGDQTPTQFRPELVMTWAKCNFDQAVKLVECYKYLEANFEIQRYLNKACAARVCDHPANTTLSNWTDAVTVHDRANKIAERAGDQNARRYMRSTRDELKARRGADFDERYPESRVSIIELARAMAKVVKPNFEDAPISEDIDLFSSKSVDDRYRMDEDGLFVYDGNDSDNVYIDADGNPIIIAEAYNDDDDDTYSEASPSEDSDYDGGRDSEAFGYWHMSVIPTDQALLGDPAGIQFYLKASKALSKTKSLKKLAKLRKCVFAERPKWNYSQKKKFWDAFKLREAEIKFEHHLLREKKKAMFNLPYVTDDGWEVEWLAEKRDQHMKSLTR